MTVHTGEAYILRTCRADMTSYDGFVWPREGLVEAPDWNPEPKCGGGLHGFLWGEGNGALANWSKDAVWLVARVNEWVDLGGKVKFPSAEVVFAGNRKDATDFIISKGARGAVIGASVVAGFRGQATAGDCGQATAGDYGQATAGDGGQATAGDCGQATAGDYGQATAGDGGLAVAGDCGQATAGDYGQATAGERGQATAGDCGILSIKWDDGRRHRIAVAYVGENGIKPNTPYRVKGGKFVEVAE